LAHWPPWFWGFPSGQEGLLFVFYKASLLRLNRSF
jgi:hypothetical protein